MTENSPIPDDEILKVIEESENPWNHIASEPRMRLKKQIKEEGYGRIRDVLIGKEVKSMTISDFDFLLQIAKGGGDLEEASYRKWAWRNLATFNEFSLPLLVKYCLCDSDRRVARLGVEKLKEFHIDNQEGLPEDVLEMMIDIGNDPGKTEEHRLWAIFTYLHLTGGDSKKFNLNEFNSYPPSRPIGVREREYNEIVKYWGNLENSEKGTSPAVLLHGLMENKKTTTNSGAAPWFSALRDEMMEIGIDLDGQHWMEEYIVMGSGGSTYSEISVSAKKNRNTFYKVFLSSLAPVFRFFRTKWFSREEDIRNREAGIEWTDMRKEEVDIEYEEFKEMVRKASEIASMKLPPTLKFVELREDQGEIVIPDLCIYDFGDRTERNQDQLLFYWND